MSELKGDKLEKLFLDSFENFEVDVNPNIWNGISSQLPATGSSTVATGMSVMNKIIIGSISVAAISVASFLVFNTEADTKDKTVVSETVNINKPVDIEENQPEIIKDNPVVSERIEENVYKNETSPIADTQNEIDIIETLDVIDNEEISTVATTTNSVYQNDIASDNNAETVTNDLVVENNSTNQNDVEVVNDIETEDNFETDVVDNSELFQTPQALVIPNVFTPNNDGINDNWFIESEGLSNFSIVILNDKQSVVFQSDKPNFKWNGTDMSGNVLKKGYYYFILMAEDINGQPIKESRQLAIQ